jgi:hypothetical protein
MTNLKNIAVSEETHRLVRKVAADQGRTLREVVEESLKMYCRWLQAGEVHGNQGD